jgi:hypothetical protein
MHFSNSILSILVLLTLVLTILVVVVLVPAAVRGNRRRTRSGQPGGRKVAILLEEHARAIERLEGAVRKLALGERHLAELADDSLRNVGLVRFDAFEDMGGRLSFSAALLDGHGDGVVITSINGRQDTRCYAKRVSQGTSPHNLSDEERQAIREALSRRDRGPAIPGSTASEPEEAAADPVARRGFAQAEHGRGDEGGVPDVQAG